MPVNEAVFTNRWRRLGLWLGPLIGPLAWLFDLQISFSAGRLSCTADTSLPLHLATLVCLLITLGGIVYTWRNWRAAGKGWPGEEEGVIPRSRLMSFIGLTVNVMFALAILFQAVPKAMLHPCQ
jgi:hypothetical protein